MCRQIQWVFSDCYDFCRGRGKAAGLLQIQACEAFPGGNPPYQPAYGHLGIRTCWNPEPENRVVNGMCSSCYEDFQSLSEEQGYDTSDWDKYPPAFIKVNDQVDDYTYKVPQAPRIDLYFREVDWNPKARKVPLDAGEVSPNTVPKFPDAPAGVLNSEYDPEDWSPVDEDREIIQLKSRDDPALGYLPRPMKPYPGYSGPPGIVPIMARHGQFFTEGKPYYTGDRYVYYGLNKAEVLKTFAPKEQEPAHPPVSETFLDTGDAGKQSPPRVPKHKTFTGKFTPPSSPKPKLKPNGQPCPEFK